MKKIGIGYEDYKRMIDDDIYYIDKTMLINDIIEKGGMVTLFTRPRRFGKTLALSMLRTFFELEYDRDGTPIDKRRYFEGKKIMNTPDQILTMMGKYPVIKLSLKSAKQPNFYNAFMKVREEIISEYERHAYIEKSDVLSEEKKEVFKSFYKNTLAWTDKRFESKEEEKEEFSIFDNDESFYHGVFLSLLYGTPDYQPRSNREEGDGRPDIVLYPENPTDPAIIFEIKTRKKFNEMQAGLQEAYDQIKDKKYEEGVLEDGYMGAKSYGICFCKKSCIVGALK